MDQPSQSASWTSAAWQIGEWIADPTDDSLTRHDASVKEGVSVKIEPRLMQLLICLAASAPQVVSIEKILAEVWSGVVVGSASVYQSISQLRKTLGDTDSPPRYIETVARKGYRLVAPVSRLVPEPAVPAAFVDASSVRGGRWRHRKVVAIGPGGGAGRNRCARLSIRHAAGAA